MEEWAKVLISDTTYVDSTHGEKIGCVFCHGGDSTSNEVQTSHVNLVADPSNGKCETCHPDAAGPDKTSLHTTLNGLKSDLVARGGDFSAGSPLSTGFQNHCSACHTSCGQCHVSRAEELNGGFIDSHEFLTTPSFANTCVACHGSRPGPEYIGNLSVPGPGGTIDYLPADVHFTSANMLCTNCHINTEMHGSGSLAQGRYSDPNAVDCLACHQDIKSPANLTNNQQHLLHLNDLSCQVCHSLSYKNCYNCHVGIDDKGLPYYQVEPSVITFEIGLNPNVSAAHPEKYVVLRHAPVASDTFKYYGNNLLPDFDSVPAWHLATPHNIQLDTPQNKTCNSCHGHPELFLLPSDIKPGEPAADSRVVVTSVPAPVP